METMKHAGKSRPILTQATTNTTLWVGHLQAEPADHFGGQTFRCPSEGTLDNIQLYSSAVQYPGEINLTLHEFDSKTKSWGAAIGSSHFTIGKKDDARWIRFDFSPIPMHKETVYGFRLQSKDALVAIGEAASGTKQPFTFGHEWNADSKNERGNFFSYFSLAFKIEMCA